MKWNFKYELTSTYDFAKILSDLNAKRNEFVFGTIQEICKLNGVICPQIMNTKDVRKMKEKLYKHGLKLTIKDIIKGTDYLCEINLKKVLTKK